MLYRNSWPETNPVLSSPTLHLMLPFEVQLHPAFPIRMLLILPDPLKRSVGYKCQKKRKISGFTNVDPCTSVKLGHT